MGLFKKFINQTRKPIGFLGKMMVNRMNLRHAKISDWGLSHLKSINPKEIVDLGCGGGRNAAELLKIYPESIVTAMDYSDVSVKKTKKFNKKMIEAGRCIAELGDVSNLKLSEGKYDLATAFETIYFWPGLERCFTEVAHVLKPGGTFLIVNELDGENEESLKYEKIIEGMKCYTTKDIELALKNSGFSDVKSIHHESKLWIVVIAKK